MKPRLHISKKVWAVLTVIFVIQVLFDPLTSILRFGEQLQARFGLPQARSKWESQGITHYKFDVSGVFSITCFISANIEVKNEVIIRAEPRSNVGLDRDSLYDPGFWGYDEGGFFCNYKNYTMPLLFSEIEDMAESEPSFFNGRSFSFVITGISFDSKYGFISNFDYGNCGGHGLLNPKISDCFAGFTIENFQVLDE